MCRLGGVVLILYTQCLVVLTVVEMLSASIRWIAIVAVVFALEFPRLAIADADYYGILGVSRDASDAQLKKAYRKMSLKYHPDKNDSPEAKEKFIEVSKAYEILSNPENRQLYDQYGEAAFRQGGPGDPQQGGQNGGFQWGPGGQGGSFEFHVEFNDPFDMFESMFKGEDTGAGFGGFNFGGFDFGGGDRFGHGFGQERIEKDKSFYSDDPHVVELTNEDWLQDFQQSKEICIVEFYTPKCGHCKSLSPSWRKLASSTKSFAKVGAINCERHRKLCQKFNIEEYPSIKMFVPPNFDKPKKYTGPMNTKSLYNFVVDNIPNSVSLVSASEWGIFLAQHPKGKLILFSEKSSSSPLFKSLSYKYEKSVSFVQIQATLPDNQDLISELGVSIEKLPALVFMNSRGQTSAYAGDINKEGIVGFLRSEFKRQSELDSASRTVTILSDSCSPHECSDLSTSGINVIFFYGPEIDKKELDKSLQYFLNIYSTDSRIKLFSASYSELESWNEHFGFPTNGVSVLLFRKKSSKFALQSYNGLNDVNSAVNFIEDALSGNVHFKPIPKI